jgi:inhibitor of cysteine peptidase
MKIDQSFDKRSVTVPVGDTIELSLPENPTTGFRWSLVGNGTPVLELKADDFVASGRTPGASGTRSFTFPVRQAGNATISLRSQRKWGDADTGQDFTLNVRATAPN